jgi:hypothetical protein
VCEAKAGLAIAAARCQREGEETRRARESRNGDALW